MVIFLSELGKIHSPDDNKNYVYEKNGDRGLKMIIIIDLITLAKYVKYTHYEIMKLCKIKIFNNVIVYDNYSNK